MTTSPFTYHRPESVRAAAVILAEQGHTARVIAGGHSLVPVMKQRLTDIDHLVDLAGIAELKGVAVKDDTVVIGAMTTQHELIHHAELSARVPIIREAALQISDPQVRYVGTIGGNVANGDPANDMPALMQLLDASYSLEGPGGTRQVGARDFYEGAYFTARRDDEILTAVSFPVPSGGYAYEKQKRKIGDFATAAAGVLITLSDGVCTAAAVALTNLAETPVYCGDAAGRLVGGKVDAAAMDAAVKDAVAGSNPVADQRGPVEFKRHVAGIIVRKAIETALSRAQTAGEAG